MPHWRQASGGGGGGQPELERGNRGPTEASSTKLQAGSIANEDFLGFWKVDICQEGCSQRSAPQKRHTAHLREARPQPPGKPSGWDAGGDKTHPPPGGDCARHAPGYLNCSNLGRAQNAGPTESVSLWSTQEPAPEWLRPGKCSQPRADRRQFPGRAT